MNNINYKKPLVSVVLPVYNASAHIAEAIDSILEQSFSDFELIIINDGSTDDSLDIIQGFSDPRIIIVDQPNKGLAATLNIGAAIGKGEYIARMDNDDISLKNRFETQVSFLRKNPSVSVVSSAIIYIDRDGKELARSFPLTSFFAVKKYLLNKGCVICHPAVMMRKKDFNEVGGYSETVGNRFTDYHLWVKFIRRGYKVINQPIVLLKYRLLNESMSSEFSLNDEATKLLRNILKTENPDSKSIIELNRLSQKEGNGIVLRINQLDRSANKLYNIIRFVGSDFAAGQISCMKNIYAFLKYK